MFQVLSSPGAAKSLKKIQKFIQYIFRYGVHPIRLMVAWGAIVIAFSILYWIGNGVNGGNCVV